MMFSWFKKDTQKESKFQNDEDYLCPKVKPLPEKDPETYYSVGLTDNNRVSISIGTYLYAKTLYMTSDGVKGMIGVLEAAMNALTPEILETDDDVEDINQDEEDGC